MKGPAEIAHGPMFIGFSFNLILYGIMITQVYLYFSTFKKDNLWMKILVLVFFLADTVNTIFDAIYLYDSLIVHFADVAYLGNANWVFATDPALTSIIAGMVQLFFAWRVKVLTSNWWIVAVLVTSSLTGLVGGIVTAYEVGITPHFVDFRNFKWSVIMWLAAECISDIVITSVLVWHLEDTKQVFRHVRLRVERREILHDFIQASDELVDRIIRLTVQTGFVTSLCASLDLIFFLTDPTGTHLIFNFPLAKLYTNSVMSSLNSRGAWKYSNTSQQQSSMPGNIITTGNFNGGFSKHSDTTSSSPSRVYVHVESHELRDVDIERQAARRSLRVTPAVAPAFPADDKQSMESADPDSSLETRVVSRTYSTKSTTKKPSNGSPDMV